MAQGKMKVKAKLPPKAKVASVHRGTSNQYKSKSKHTFLIYSDINYFCFILNFS